jgi:hypothetical protein
MLDFVELRLLVNQLEIETIEAATAKTDLDAKEEVAAAANAAVSAADEVYQAESADILSTTNALIAKLQAAIDGG